MPVHTVLADGKSSTVLDTCVVNARDSTNVLPRRDALPAFNRPLDIRTVEWTCDDDRPV